MNKNELYGTVKDTFTVNTVFRTYKDMKGDNCVFSSGVVVLLISSQNRDK